jgi:hypothetical protein
MNFSFKVNKEFGVGSNRFTKLLNNPGQSMAGLIIIRVLVLGMVPEK